MAQIMISFFHFFFYLDGYLLSPVLRLRRCLDMFFSNFFLLSLSLFYLWFISDCPVLLYLGVDTCE